jgi:acid stress chaperone HdeB
VRFLSIILTAAVLALSSPAQAQKVDLSTLPCKDFITMDINHVMGIMMWMTGYYSDQDASPIIDFDKMKGDLQKLIEYCRANPTMGLITAAEETIANQ